MFDSRMIRNCLSLCLGTFAALSGVNPGNEAAAVFAQKTSAQASEQIRGKRPVAKEKLVTLKGRIDQTMNAEKFQISLKEIKTTLNKQVELKRAPFPAEWESYSVETRLKWIKEFKESDKGQAFVAANQKIIDEAPAFNLRFNKEGEFIVYDVPPGTYGLQGRIDKEINGVKYAFEVFGQIGVNGQFDEVALDSIAVLVTPMLASGQKAPKIDVWTHNGKKKLSFETLQVENGKPSPRHVFLNFWSTQDSAGAGQRDYQATVQKMISELTEKGYEIGLLSICLDDDRETAIRVIMKNQYRIGLHGFTDGWDHATVNRYGVRSTPSGWLIDPDGKIVMSQYEFYNLTKVKQSLTEVVQDRLDGKDTPTPAEADSTEADSE